MAIRIIRKRGDEVLNMISKPVTKYDARLHQLIDDMIDTMHYSDGVGLAAVQVGVLKRVAIVLNEGKIIEIINPVIIEQTGSQEDTEACLSVPGIYGYVLRPQKITVNSFDRNGNEQTHTVSDFQARAFCHEIDHLDGILFLKRVSKFVEKG